jgi:nucleoside 2-deoxyribosyltransferase
MDGADPDSGTCWEVGYAYGKKPIVLVRTDMRRNQGSGGSGYNPMLTESATLRIDAIAAPMDRIAGEVLAALGQLEGGVKPDVA